MNGDMKSLLDNEDLNGKIFFPVTYEMENSYPVRVDDTCTLHCKYICYPGVKRAVVIFYGNGECAESYAESELVEEITRAGSWNCFIAEYRGYGMSTGRLNIVNVLNDAGKVMEAVAQEGNGKIVVFGRSLGGFSAIQSISCCPGVSGVILESAYSCLSDFIAKRWPLTNNEKQELDDFFNYPEKVKDYHNPVLLIHGLRDTLVPFRHCTALRQLFEGHSERVIMFSARGGHNNVFQMNAESYLGHVRRFLRFVG